MRARARARARGYAWRVGDTQDIRYPRYSIFVSNTPCAPVHVRCVCVPARARARARGHAGRRRSQRALGVCVWGGGYAGRRLSQRLQLIEMEVCVCVCVRACVLICLHAHHGGMVQPLPHRESSHDLLHLEPSHGWYGLVADVRNRPCAALCSCCPTAPPPPGYTATHCPTAPFSPPPSLPPSPFSLYPCPLFVSTRRRVKEKTGGWPPLLVNLSH